LRKLALQRSSSRRAWAGGPGPIAPVAEVDMDDWVACMNINLIGAMYCLQEAARIMAAQKSGSIINMSSLMGIQGYPMRSAYVASKFALIGITETWRASWDRWACG
jgi:NAD(P)-dependent dehydrogenase (short-subunit alcohol dehydrogenase family)